MLFITPRTCAASWSRAEVERTVNPVGLIGLGGARHNIGWGLAGQRVTLRLDGTVTHVLNRNRILLATLPCPIPATEFGRLQGAHPAGPSQLAPVSVPATAERIVSTTGTFMVARQLVKLGRQHARAVAQVAMDEASIQVFHTGPLIATVARTTNKNIRCRSSGELRRRAA
ncbi:MAG: hypothetical protein ACJ786_33285 [Catenulispora sp.]